MFYDCLIGSLNDSIEVGVAVRLNALAYAIKVLLMAGAKKGLHRNVRTMCCNNGPAC